MGINISNSNTIDKTSTMNELQYIQQEECQNTDTELDIQHHLITGDKKGQAITHRYSGNNNNGYGQEKRMYGQQQ